MSTVDPLAARAHEAQARCADATQASSAPLELVVSRYREDLGWLRNTPPGLRLTVYDKGEQPWACAALSASFEARARRERGPAVLVDGDARPSLNGGGTRWPTPPVLVARLPNRGHEAHSYLQHLVERYDSLADVTVFCQGHPFDHCPGLHYELRDLASGRLTVVGFRWLGFRIDSDDPDGTLFRRWSKNRDGRGLPLRAVYRQLFGAEAPAVLRFVGGAQFAVTAALARRRPRDFYERARDLAATTPDAAHCFERLWDQVFGVLGVDERLLGTAGSACLKPIRGLCGAPAPQAR